MRSLGRAAALASASLPLACFGCGAASSLPTGTMADADGGATPEVVYLLPSSATGTAAVFIVPTTHPSDRPYYYGEYQITITPP
jgi:hypothetical protein